MAGSSPRLVPPALALLALAGPAPVIAQGPVTVDGQVVRVVAGDTLAVPGARVVLHRVARGAEGPLDSVLAGPDGRFRFRLVPDTAGIHLLSARHHGIEHFGTPLDLHPGDPPVRVALVVSDTSSSAPIGIAARYLLVGAPDEEGERLVLDVIVLQNLGDATRVAPDPETPNWVLRLPMGTQRTVVEQGTEISPDAITITGGQLVVSAPIAPGLRQIVLGHAIPGTAERLAIPFSLPVDSVTVLAEEKTVAVEGGLRAAPRMMGGEEVTGWTGAMAVGSELVLRFTPVGNRSGGLLAGLVAVMVVLLGAAMALARRRAGGVPDSAAAEADPVEPLVEELARLDHRWRGGQGDASPEEWADYQARRVNLRRRLDAALAARRRHP